MLKSGAFQGAALRAGRYKGAPPLWNPDTKGLRPFETPFFKGFKGAKAPLGFIKASFYGGDSPLGRKLRLLRAYEGCIRLASKPYGCSKEGFGPQASLLSPLSRGHYSGNSRAAPFRFPNNFS